LMSTRVYDLVYYVLNIIPVDVIRFIESCQDFFGVLGEVSLAK